ncbi:TonB-dependent receptor [Filimonas effusa]|uniref:TonB-dependent receptor n=1 Tax=Filimonas effusa TaxID=2508721 RepID=A0A4Q1D4F1_9BACT|nr:carboxypeptidase regulatory-like domain-containing protein [Filimonas effusa]RXK83315.1 TonB-dependent receptor [Filimonas effusa]
MRLFKLAFYFMLFACTSLSVKAQITSAQVSGRIIGPKDEVLDGVSIKLVNPSTGSSYDAHTNKDGRYLIANLNPGGPYTITVSFVGKKEEVKTDLQLTLGTNTINFKMQDESAILETVVVKGGRKNGLKTGAGIQIGQNQLKSLPTISRSLQDMTRVTPQSSNNSFMGTNFRYNNVTLDGAINNDAIGFSPSLGGQTNASGQPGSSTRTNPVSMDAIQDIQVYLAPYDVKIGNFLGGSINAVTRSGTNEVHGSVYGFGRNASLTGKNNAGDKSKMPSDFHDYQTGFRVGLPIIKNKLFFFTNEEITRRQDPVILAAGSSDMPVITEAQAIQISDYMKNTYGVDAGTYGNYKIYSNSTKFFNRVDWHINSKNQLSIRNNTIRSEATNLERDQQNFRFSSIDFKQVNNQTSTVAELKTRFSNSLSNSLVLGYSDIHDYRNPLSNPALPQIQIANNSGTIFLGTDREASIFNMKQKTFEFTDNFTYLRGNHTFTFGTHNEFYNITYGFVNSWNGRVEYGSIKDFLENNPKRVRTNYNYTNNTRDYIMNNPPAQFKVNLYSTYAQDEIQLSSRFKLTPGLRFDLADMPNKQPLSSKTTGSPVDPNYGTTYNYTLPKNIQNKFLGKVQVSPRIGFNYDVKGDQSLILRGGTGVFTGRIPFAWLGYAYYNNGVTYGSYDGNPPAKVAGTDPIRDAISGNNGEANYAQKNNWDISDPAKQTQVDLIDNNFKMPQAWRSSLAMEYTTDNQWKFSVEGIYTKVIYDLKFQQVNITDAPTYMVYDTQKQQPIFPKSKINSLFTNAYLLSNTKEGYRYSLTGQVNKTFPFGLNFMAAYTYGQSKDITNGIRNSMESNWQLNQALNPNSPGLAYSNFDVRHRIVSTVNYRLDWNKSNKFISNFALFFNTQSGVPFTYGTLNTINNAGQQVGLVYIPTKAEVSNFFTNQATAAAFDAYIDGNKYLNSRRGNFTERNGGRTPWNTQLDFRFAQDFNIKTGKHMHTITFTYDIINLTNLLNGNWGHQYFSPNTFNSTADIGLGSPSVAGTATAYPKYDNWKKPNSAPYSIDFFGSRYQMQAGLRYSF